MTTLFLIGCALQIFNAALNKFCSLYQHMGAAEPEVVNTRTYRAFSWPNSMTWIDLCCGGISFLVFAVAVGFVVPVFVDSSGAAVVCDVSRLRFGGECR